MLEASAKTCVLTFDLKTQAAETCASKFHARSTTTQGANHIHSRQVFTLRSFHSMIVDGVFSVTNHEETLNSSDVATLLESSVQNVGCGNGSCTDMVSLRVATANVNTLSPSDESADGPTLALTGRILALQSQFAQCGLQMVGIQEGRMRNSAMRMCPDYFCLVTPANASGCFGCELWVSTVIPWSGICGGAKRFFKPNDFQVMFADERMLGVAAGKAMQWTWWWHMPLVMCVTLPVIQTVRIVSGGGNWCVRSGKLTILKLASSG